MRDKKTEDVFDFVEDIPWEKYAESFGVVLSSLDIEYDVRNFSAGLNIYFARTTCGRRIVWDNGEVSLVDNDNDDDETK